MEGEFPPSLFTARCLLAAKNVHALLLAGLGKCKDTSSYLKLELLQLLPCTRCLILSSRVLFPKPMLLVLWSRCPYPRAPIRHFM